MSKKPLLTWRAWLKSKTLKVFGLLGAIAAIDGSFFEGDLGMMVLSAWLTLLNAAPFLNLTAEQGISSLIVIISGVGVWLRSVTNNSLADK